MNQILTLANGLSLKLNSKDLTATVVNSIKVNGDLFIPRSIKHDSHDYIITGFEKGSFRENTAIKSIRFASNSEFQSIDCEAFSNSSIEQISIPPSCKELKIGCFLDASKLTQVLISTESKHFNYADQEKKLISSKSEVSIEKFNVLIFSCHDIKKAIIPSTIQEIGPFSFYRCEKLKTVEFENDSELCLIDKCAFLSSSLEKIRIPNSVTRISEYSFSECENLFKFEISEGSKLCEIGQCTFSKTSLVNISIPKSVMSIGECAFSMCSALKSVEFLGNNLKCEKFCFYLCKNLFLISFPNAKFVPIKINAHDSVSKDFSLFICS